MTVVVRWGVQLLVDKLFGLANELGVWEGQLGEGVVCLLGVRASGGWVVLQEHFGVARYGGVAILFDVLVCGRHDGSASLQGMGER